MSDAPLTTLIDPSHAPGTILAGRYRVEARLGEGGMGVVLKATQIDLDRVVALKLLLPEFRGNLQVIERFYREAKAAARIQGEHVARILDVGKLESGEPYIAMEFLDGEDLGHLLEREGRLSIELATTYMLHACAAVAEAHAARIVHRDLKPQNLFLASTPHGKSVLKVLDFGISRVDEGASHLTQTASALGTAFYMAPEQITSPKMIDVRADIWSLGVVYYELLTGKMPFDGDTLPQVVAHVIRNERVRARDVIPDVPDAVDAIIDRCLQQEPSARFQNAVELASALANIGRDAEDISMVRHLKSLPPPPPSITSEAPSTREPSLSELARTAAALPSQVPDLNLAREKPSISEQPRAMPARAPAAVAPASKPIPGGDISFDTSDMPKIELDRGNSPSQSVNAYDASYHEQHALLARRVAIARRRDAEEDEEPPRKFPWLKIIVALMLIGIPLLAVFVVAPRVLGARIDSAAAGAGMTITHDAPSLSLTGVELKNVSVTFADAKDTKILVRSAHAAFAGDGIILNDVRATSTTTPLVLMRVLGEADSKIPWSVDAEDLAFEYTPKPDVTITCAGKFSTRLAQSSRNVWLDCADTRVKTSHGEAGPFALSVDRTHGLWGGSVAVPDSATTGVVSTASLVTTDHGSQFNAEIANAPLAKLHLAPSLVDLPDKDNPEIDLKIEARTDANGNLEGTGSFAARNATLGAARFAVAWDFTIAGNADGIQLKNKTAKIGPFSAQLNGAWKISAPLTAAISYRTTAFSCAELARQRSKRASKNASVVPIFQAIGGNATESGEVRIAGAITVNPAADPILQTTLDNNDTCGLLIFPRKL